MVQLANPGRRRPAPDPRPKAPPPVKLELEDPIEDEHSPLDKRSRISPPPHPQWSAGAPFSLLEEPSPLGLRLRKSPSLLDLIQMRLSQADSVTASSVMSSDTADAAAKKDLKSTAASAATDKMKASNFPALLLRIGTWECVSRYEGDLVAKCYFAKHKLVWEVLDGGLKSKIEIQWSDITAVKASLPENGPGTLDIVLARQPLFFRETNPQPRKHTLWQATSDFTGGQASIQRRHFIQCAQGLLNKHFEKIIQCDPRLNALSRQPDINLDSPYFETRCPVFENQAESKCHVFDNTMDVCASGVSGFRDLGSPSIGPSVSTTSESTIGRTLETPSPSSVMDTKLVDESTNKRTEESSSSRCWDQVKVPVLGGSMSMSDLVNHIGHCISEQKTLSNPFLSADGSPNKDMLEDLAQYLLGDSQMSSALGDSQIPSASDEQSLMSRVNSLCCLLQKDAATFQSLRIEGGDDAARNGFLDENVEKSVFPVIAFERKPMFDLSTSERKPLFDLSAADEFSDASSYKQPPPSISRKESFGELLMHLPRIASLPQVLFKITEDPENQAR